MKKLCLLAVAMLTASFAQAANLDATFTNLDFDASTQQYFPLGWDAAAYDIPGWQDATAITDGGIEFEGAWWSPYQEYSAFVKSGEGLFNLSSYVIQSGDVFDISTFAKRWNSNDLPELDITLFYGADPSTNAIGTFNTGVLTDAWTEYGGLVASSAASVGQTLGVRVMGSGTWFSNFDELSISTTPEPTSLGVLGIAGLALAGVRRRQAC